ncbi:hypothetical protein RRG08_038450 [Elysia crispata]|uniref:Uncharacterized protein n=1 Tax=Elysia crispata TaxID=231223 RepID=A0AAE1ANJ8_9GAST|nr:hypothetical protein RRG08_038450 [Elysia crispata]
MQIIHSASFLLLKSSPASSAKAELDPVGGKPSRMYSLYHGDRSKPTGVLFLFFLDCKATGLLTGLFKLWVIFAGRAVKLKIPASLS